MLGAAGSFPGPPLQNPLCQALVNPLAHPAVSASIPALLEASFPKLPKSRAPQGPPDLPTGIWELVGPFLGHALRHAAQGVGLGYDHCTPKTQILNPESQTLEGAEGPSWATLCAVLFQVWLQGMISAPQKPKPQTKP